MPEALCSIIEFKNHKIKHFVGNSLPKGYIDSLNDLDSKRSISKMKALLFLTSKKNRFAKTLLQLQ